MNRTRTWLRQDDAWIEGASLPATDRAVRYGMAVFETIGVREGRALLADEHFALLAQGTRQLFGIMCPPVAPPALGASCQGVLRIYITAGDGGPADEVTHPRVFALFESTGEAPDVQTACLHAEPVMPFGHGCKTANYWMNCFAQAAANKSGHDHALLRDPAGNILSAAFGNIFFVLDGTLCTPAPSLAVRPGVIRAWVIHKSDVREVEFPATRLAEASELFLTNSRLGVVPLRFGTTGPGPVGRSLQDACHAAKITP